jgi:hypothetical protein
MVSSSRFKESLPTSQGCAGGFVYVTSMGRSVPALIRESKALEVYSHRQRRIDVEPGEGPHQLGEARLIDFHARFVVLQRRRLAAVDCGLHALLSKRSIYPHGTGSKPSSQGFCRLTSLRLGRRIESMSAVPYTFSEAQNLAPEAMPAGTVLPEGYVGTSTDEHLAGIFADLAGQGVSLSNLPLSVTLPRPMLHASANFYAQGERIACLLESAGRSDSAARLRQEGAWWDFENHLPLDADEAAGNYLLHLRLRFDEQFESMVPALCAIFDETVGLPKIETLERFQRLMSQSVEEDGLTMSPQRAWHVSQAWEYGEVRKLLASTMDLEYGLQLAELGADSFEEAQHLSKTMPKHWIDSLLSDVPDEA